MQLSTPNSSPICGTIDSLLSLRDAFRQESRRGLEKQISDFLGDASPEEIGFLGEVLTVRNQCADGDFRLASAIEWGAGNSRAIPTPGETPDSTEPILGWVSITNEEPTIRPTKAGV